MKKFVLVSFISLLSSHAMAAQPIFSVTPIYKAVSSYFNNEIGTTVYQITNNTPYTLNTIGIAQMPSGVQQNTNSVSSFSQYCSNPFNLAPGASCLLKVQLNANQLSSGLTSGPIVCDSPSKPVYCSSPYSTDQINTSISQSPLPQTCSALVSDFNSTLSQNFDSTTDFTTGWGPARNSLSITFSSCIRAAGLDWARQRIVAAAAFWIAQKLNYCHHYNPDYATPASQRSASGTSGGYCNPAIDTMPGSVYYGQQARWNYTGQGSETANNWVNNNQMWYGMDCSNTTAFIYNFAFGTNRDFGIPFDSKTGFQAGQQSTGCVNNVCPQDNLSPNQQVPSDPTQILNNPNEAGVLVCADGTVDPDPLSPSMCTGHGGYLSGINSSGTFTKSVTVAQVAQVLQPGDLLFIAGGGPDPQPNPDGSSSMVTHVIMWIGKQVGYGPNDINPALIAPNDAPCANQSIWQPNVGDWVIADSHYQGYDYRILTTCFYLNDLWGVRRVIVNP